MRKNILLPVLCMTVFILATSFKMYEDTPPQTAANGEAIRIEGIYVFVDSKPTTPYDFLGVVKNNRFDFYSYSHARRKLVEKTVKKYPGCQAIIVTITNNDALIAEAIRFKQ